MVERGPGGEAGPLLPKKNGPSRNRRRPDPDGIQAPLHLRVDRRRQRTPQRRLHVLPQVLRPLRADDDRMDVRMRQREPQHERRGADRY